jgi:2-keto-4-pentenoate hydratase/2-oxohepta-3-ene-1,7-dioic acid hydratase in catechol pathway
MRLASFHAEGRQRFGIVTGGGLVDLTGKTEARGVKDVLAAGPRSVERFLDASPDWNATEVTWLPPVPDPALIVGIGLNTKSHFQETAERMNRKPGDYPQHPRLFIRTPDSHVGHNRPIEMPTVSTRLDYEGEIAIVIGKGGRNIPHAQALDHIGGYACYTDGSVRDFQRHSVTITSGKNFVASGSFGPWLVTADEVPDPQSLTLETRINGEVRQRLAMEDLIFSFAELIAYTSIVFELRPGDVIATGSPEGIGAISGKWLKPGDLVEIEVPAVGTLSNRVVAAGEPS